MPGELDEWLSNGNRLYEVAKNQYERTKAAIDELVKTGQEELKTLNQIGAALGKPAYDAPIAAALQASNDPPTQRPAGARVPRAERLGPKPPPHDRPSGTENGTDDEGFGPDEA